MGEEKLFANKYKTSSIRASWHDYTCGVYMVTLCIQNRIHALGEVEEKQGCRTIEYTGLGKIAQEEIMAIEKHNNGVSVATYAIMPDHIHLIIAIEAQSETNLPSVIGRFKAAVSRRIHTPIWQRGYYDTIARNDQHAKAMEQYVKDNIWRWGQKKGQTVTMK